MPVVKHITGRNVSGFVEVHGEVLFMPTGDVGRWTRSFSSTLQRAAARFAPSNKRPRWSHYGPPLKTTMRASTDYDPATLRVHAAVGSTAPYSLYVDQGTGIYGGNGPYEAKVVPPWPDRGYQLYEYSWLASAKGRKPWMIKGQEGQEFFDKALAAAFSAKRMLSVDVPGGVVASIDNKAVQELGVIMSAAEADAAAGAFRQQLDVWRAERDRYWAFDHPGRQPRAQTPTPTSKPLRQVDVSKAASGQRAKEQRDKIRKTEADKAKGRQKRAEEQRQRELASQKRLAGIFAQKQVNRDFTEVFRREIKRDGATVGYIVYFTDPSTGAQNSRRFLA